MARLVRHREEEESNIDLTPMLDVVFIMLIFFIVTASFIKESGIEINRPESTETPPSDSTPLNIVFTVTANDEIWLDGRRIDIRAVRANVERLHAERPKAAVVIRADKKATAKTYAGIADYARESNVYDVSLTVVETK